MQQRGTEVLPQNLFYLKTPMFLKIITLKKRLTTAERRLSTP